ncbi:MAG: response regulator [Chloroflexi bacterium]|nr:response regulator [Chloroflexota bacterium]
MAVSPVLLYVDDDSTSRQVMEMLVTYSLGWPGVVLFEDSENFIERVESLSPAPDVIFLDIHIQPHDGFAMLKMLRAHKKFSRTTVIALTASVMNEEVDLLKKAGFDGGIAKPISMNEFPELMQRVLNGEKIWHIR